MKNRLVGQCWDYKSSTTDQTRNEMTICFHQDDIHMFISSFYMGVGMGRDMGWQKWYTNGNIIYLLEASDKDNSRDHCHIEIKDDAPHFYSCTPDAREWLEVSWGESIIRQKIKPTKIEQ